jgi:hypothetical protein
VQALLRSARTRLSCAIGDAVLSVFASRHAVVGRSIVCGALGRGSCKRSSTTVKTAKTLFRQFWQ